MRGGGLQLPAAHTNVCACRNRVCRRLHCPPPRLQEARGIKLDVELTGPDLREVVRRFKAVFAAAGKSLPDDPLEQLRLSINAVFGSWNTPRAVKYR